MSTYDTRLNSAPFVPAAVPNTPCANAAIIPCFVVENTINLKGLRDCLVRVTKTNATYYIDHYYRQLMIFQGPYFKGNYDFANNPDHIANGIVFDFNTNTGAAYDAAGRYKKFDLHD